MIGNLLYIEAPVFLAVSSFVMWIALSRDKHHSHVRDRLDGLARRDSRSQTRKPAGRMPVPTAAKAAFSTMGSRLLPNDEAQRSRLQARLVQAGIYSSTALTAYVAVKMMFLLLPAALGVAAVMFNVCGSLTGLMLGAVGSGLGMLLPSLWLDLRKARRQRVLRRSLPDFLDLTIACLEGGLSLQGAMQRVTDELRIAHPTLAGEMSIVQREIELGGTTEVALKHFADRSGIDAVRSLSTFVHQSQRFGATVSEAMRVYADSLRTQREQRAEELAQRAAVMILFPTLLFIFPAIFVVIAGPAAIQLHEKFAQPNDKPPSVSAATDTRSPSSFLGGMRGFA